jgi:hypothetical protein
VTDVPDENTRNPLGLDWRELVGKYVLVGLTTKDSGGTVLSTQQIHGRISSADPGRGLSIEMKGARDGGTYDLPPDLRSLELAAPGEYRLRSTGEIIYDPDYLITWIIEKPPSA